MIISKVVIWLICTIKRGSEGCRIPHFPLFFFLLLWLASAQPAWSADDDWIWSRRLDEIGFDDGIRAPQRTAELTAFWSVPEAARGGDAALDLTIATLAPSHFSGQARVSIDGIPAGTAQIAPGAAEAALHLAVPREATRDGHLRIDLTAVADDETSVCTSRARAVTLALLPQSRLAVALPAPPAGDAALALLPATVVARVPEGAMSAETFRDILVISTALARLGHRIVFTTQDNDRPDLVFAARGEHITADKPGRLTVPATRATAEALAKRPLPAPVRTGDDPALALSALGVTTTAKIAAPQADWSFVLPLDALPAELTPSAVRVELTGPVDGDGARHMLTLRVNDQLTASRLLTLGEETHMVTLPIASGALGARNALQISLTRIGIGAVCGATPLPVSLGPGSLVTFTAAPEDPRQFYEFTRLAPGGMTLWVEPAALADPARHLAFALALATSTVRNLSKFTVRTIDGAVPHAPFLYLARDPPPGASMDSLPDAASGVSFTTLVRAGAANGIWLRPATTPDHGQAIAPLVRGHAARFAENGDLYWYNSNLETGRTVWSAQGQLLARFIARYWPWTAALLWLGASATLLVALIRRRAGSS